MLRYCVKNVNNRIVLRSINCAVSPTNQIHLLFIKSLTCLKSLLLTILNHRHYTTLSTSKNYNKSLLENSFTYYPQDLLLRPLFKKLNERK